MHDLKGGQGRSIASMSVGVGSEDGSRWRLGNSSGASAMGHSELISHTVEGWMGLAGPCVGMYGEQICVQMYGEPKPEMRVSVQLGVCTMVASLGRLLWNWTRPQCQYLRY